MKSNISISPTKHNYFSDLRIHTGSSVSAFALLIAVLCATVAMPSVPEWLVSLFSNNIFKLFYLTSILFIFNFCPLTALLVALIFLIVMQSINNYIILKSTSNKSIANNIVQSVANTASDIVSDTGDILSSIADGIIKTHDYIINEDAYENLHPSSTNNLTTNMYTGAPFPVEFKDSIPEKQVYYSKDKPTPFESSNLVSKEGQVHLDAGGISELNYIQQYNKYQDEDFNENLKGINTANKYMYLIKPDPQPLSQTAALPASFGK